MFSHRLAMVWACGRRPVGGEGAEDAAPRRFGERDEDCLRDRLRVRLRHQGELDGSLDAIRNGHERPPYIATFWLLYAMAANGLRQVSGAGADCPGGDAAGAPTRSAGTEPAGGMTTGMKSASVEDKVVDGRWESYGCWGCCRGRRGNAGGQSAIRGAVHVRSAAPRPAPPPVCHWRFRRGGLASA